MSAPARARPDLSPWQRAALRMMLRAERARGEVYASSTNRTHATNDGLRVWVCPPTTRVLLRRECVVEGLPAIANGEDVLKLVLTELGRQVAERLVAR